ncbi:hypothetical protein [Caldalkalibacillus mannanilyticus]|uniref:hypothetical protein n=1 Tax=Caldalkalibacillus mannanilyticus TaxID=1418 RepID=UPI00046A7823|nr:hypothetical protein [Caldalkalibacillus mannanilyticus]
MENLLSNIEWCHGDPAYFAYGPKSEDTIRVSWARTLIGWFNVMNIETGEVINMNPIVFRYYFDVDRKASVGACDIKVNCALSIGFNVVGSEAVAV